MNLNTLELPNITKLPYTRGLFLDNDHNHIVSVGSCTGIDTIEIPESSPIPPMDASVWQKFAGAMGPEGVKTLKAFLHFTNQFAFDPVSGIQAEHISRVYQWVQAEEYKLSIPLAIFMDFDRTITMCEGIVGQGSAGLAGIKKYIRDNFSATNPAGVAEFEAITMDGFVEMYMGGLQRKQMMQEFFNVLYTVYGPSLDFWILTNNSLCSTNRQLLIEFMDVLTGGKPVRFLCGSLYPSKKAAIQDAQQNPDIFTSICPAAAGGKRKQRRYRKTRAGKKRQAKKTRKN
jgi:hypothetical protein